MEKSTEIPIKHGNLRRRFTLREKIKIVDWISDAVSNGLTLDTACYFVGVARRRYYDWIRYIKKSGDDEKLLNKKSNHSGLPSRLKDIESELLSFVTNRRENGLDMSSTTIAEYASQLSPEFRVKTDGAKAAQIHRFLKARQIRLVKRKSRKKYPIKRTWNDGERSAELKDQSLHHEPDIKPSAGSEKLGHDSRKNVKNERFIPEDLGEFMDFPSNHFDGGDNDMGLSSDGIAGLQKVGQNISPHAAGTLGARTLYEKGDNEFGKHVNFMGDILEGGQGMDEVQGQQIGNWEAHTEIPLANRQVHQKIQGLYDSKEVGNYQEVPSSKFGAPINERSTLEGTITMNCPIHGQAQSDIMLKNPYTGFAKFRAGFVGEPCHEWSIIPRDGYLKQNEATHFVVSFRPRNRGMLVGYLIIETSSFKKTWRVVGSTVEHELRI